MGTQWRAAGMSGQYHGLDYTPLFARLDRLGLTHDEWEQAFDDVRVCEAAAIEQMRANQ
jgi:hypothetical protein